MAATAPVRAPLVGRTIRLDPMTIDDAEALLPILADPENYADGYGMSTPLDTVDEARAFVEARMAASPGHLAFVGRLIADGTTVGTSSIGDVELRHETTHVGWTMWDRPHWGSAVNPEAKLLMLGHLFEDCGFERVLIQTDIANQHSQAAIAKLGAQREGVLRHHLIRADGSRRDTVVFSLLRDEWPDARARLEARLA